MAGKTDAELHLYLDRRAEYRDDAVLAALAELERRGHHVPDAASLRGELEEAVRQAAALAPPAAPAWQRPAEEEEAEPAAATAPALYSPGTIAILSIVLSYPVGAVLMLLNLLKLRRYGGAALLLALCLLIMSTQLWLLLDLKFSANVVGLCVNAAAALLYVFVLWPFFIGRQLYQPRSWLPPFIITCVLVMLLMILAQQAGVPLPSLKQ